MALDVFTVNTHNYFLQDISIPRGVKKSQDFWTVRNQWKCWSPTAPMMKSIQLQQAQERVYMHTSIALQGPFQTILGVQGFGFNYTEHRTGELQPSAKQT